MPLSHYPKIHKEIQRLTSQLKKYQTNQNSPTQVPNDIEQYALSKGIRLSPDQIRILKAVLTNKPVIVNAAHSVGKSLLAAVLCCWFFETKPNSIGMITAPTNRQITEILFKEMRRVFPTGPFAPKANSLFKQSDWWVNGYATNSGDSWQGKHSPGGILIVLDEAAGVDKVFWERSHSMFESGKQNHFMLCIGNPYTRSSPMFMEAETGKYHVMNMSALTHPNVVHKKEIIPGAITYDTVIQRIKNECRPAFEQDMHRSFEFENTHYVSENPLFDVQILGQYPQQADYSLWTEQDLFNLQLPLSDDPTYKVTIGCDVARYGSANTVFAVRRGPNLIHLEKQRGYSIVQTANRLKELCNIYQTKGFNPCQVPVNIDGTGIGSGVVDLKGTGSTTYNFIEVHNSHKPNEKMENYVPNKRCELWISFRDLARKKQVSISMVDRKLQLELLKELRLPEFSIDTKGRTVLESKDKIMERLGASPDLADAVGLCFMLPSKRYESHF